MSCQREIGRLQEFADRFRAKASKASQAQSKLKQIERMDRIEAPTSDAKEMSFSFPQPQRSGQRVITLEGIHHAYGENVVYRGLDDARRCFPAENLASFLPLKRRLDPELLLQTDLYRRVFGALATPA